MSYAEYQKHFEEEGEREEAFYDSMSVEAIMEEIEKRKFGTTYQIWYSLAKRATVEQVGWKLFEILSSREEYLTRYHCAAALLRLFNPYPDVFEPVKLSGKEKYDVMRHLEEMETELTKRIGEKPKSRTRRWWQRR